MPPLKERPSFPHGPQRKRDWRVMEIGAFSAQERRPFATIFLPLGILLSLPVRNFSFASIIEMGPLGHWVSIIGPVSCPGKLSTLYQVRQDCTDSSQMVWRAEKPSNESERSSLALMGTAPFSPDPTHSLLSL